MLEHDAALMRTLAESADLITSALTLVETRRAILRARFDRRLKTAAAEQAALRELEAFGERSTIIDITAAVLERAARPFPTEPVRTLDAIHLATIEILSGSASQITVLSRDYRVRTNAEALGCHIA